jgi:crossover junction endodeoxyribonuclease RuvC
MIVLGIDPGSSCTGYGVISVHNASLQHLDHGVIRVGSRCSLPSRLLTIYRGIIDVIETHRPHWVAVESIFHAQNARSSLILGHARGVVLLAAVNRSIDVCEYSALQVKQAVTGYGRAEKAQIRALVQSILAIRVCPPMDASDALALAICHAHSHRLRQQCMEE